MDAAILGLPELALPIGFIPAGVPIGTVLGGQPYGEDRLLAVAAAYQAVAGWHRRRPPNPPGATPPPTTVDSEPRARAFSHTAPTPDPARGRLTVDDVLATMQ
jgi:hypothetical protein